MADNDKTVIVEKDAEPTTNSNPLVVIVAIVVLIVLAVLAYNYFAGNNQSTDTGAGVNTGTNTTAPATTGQ